MLNKLLQLITGRDDLERVALKENLALLNQRLKTRKVWIPQKPRRFLDPAEFSREKLLALIEKESRELSGESLELWVLVVDGKKRLPVFSSQERMTTFSERMSKQLNKVFGLGCIEVILDDVLKQLDIDVVDLNLFSDKSWEIQVNSPGSALP